MYNVSIKIKNRQSVVAGKPATLYFQIIYRRKVGLIPLPYQVAENEWEKVKEEILYPLEVSAARMKELRSISRKLDRDRCNVCSVVDSIKKRASFTVEDIVVACLERFEASNLKVYTESLISKLKTDDKQETAHHYRSTLNAFMEFREGCDICFDEFDPALLKAFETYLYDKQLRGNTVSFYLRNLRAIWNRAAKDGLVEYNPMLFKDVNTKVEKTRKLAVEEDVINQMIVLELLLPGLALARDLFLFSYYTRGMAFVDLAHLKKSNIKGNKLIYYRKKTGQRLEIRLLSVMKDILARYRKTPGPYLFPILQSGNPSHKEYTSALRLQNKRLKKLGALLGVHLSTYVARHTWASVALQKGVSEEVISRGMGHESLKTTRIYIAFRNNTEIDDANEIVIFGKKTKSNNRYSKYSY